MADFNSIFPVTSSPVARDATYVNGFRPSPRIGGAVPSYPWITFSNGTGKIAI